MIGGPRIAVTASLSFDSSDKRASVLGALLLQVARLRFAPQQGVVGQQFQRATHA
jgi:hypothetical protein